MILLDLAVAVLSESASFVCFRDFIPPAGVVPKGDSLATRMAAGANYDDFLLPNVSIGVPSFNLSFAPAVTGIGMGRATDATNLVEPLGDTLDTETAALLRAAREASGSCVGAGYSDPPSARVDIARDRVEALLGMDLGPAFDFSADEDLQARYGIETQVVGRDEIRRLVPAISERMVAGAWCPGEGKINPLLATTALAEAARAAEVDMQQGTLSSVQMGMGGESTLRSEALATDPADEGSLSSVQMGMGGESTLRSEALATDLADEGAFSTKECAAGHGC